jgi:hypothetical protein
MTVEHNYPASWRMFLAVLQPHDSCVATVRFLPLGNGISADCGKYFLDAAPKSRAP